MSASTVTWFDEHVGSVSATLTFVLIVVTIIYASITYGLLLSAKTKRDDRRDREQSEQARLIAGHIAITGRAPEFVMITANLVNASRLPVRAVTGRLYRTDTDEHVKDFETLVVLAQQSEARPSIRVAVELSDKLLLRIDFDDDAGVRWRKYESEDQPLVRVARER
jgi:hypothetical protein